MPISDSVSIAIFSIMAVIMSTTTGSPVSDLPWASPCGTTTTTSDTSGIFFPTPAPTLPELVSELHLRTVEAHLLSMGLKDLFFTNRLSSSNSLAQVLEGYHLQNYPLPSDVQFWTHVNQTGDIAKNDYINLSKVSVFLEAVKFDDIVHDNSTHLSSIQNLEKKILSMICVLDNILTALDLSVESHVTRMIMPDTLREITSIADRNQRDYIVAKDCVHLLTSTKDSHIAMKLGYQ